MRAGGQRSSRCSAEWLLILILCLAACGATEAPRENPPDRQSRPAQQVPEKQAQIAPSPFASEECAAIQETLQRMDRRERRYRQDGVVFQNRERRLPLQPSGYYHEFTVETPGSANRGARRVVQGRAGETYYTRDHYQTFLRIASGDYNGGSCSLKILPE